MASVEGHPEGMMGSVGVGFSFLLMDELGVHVAPPLDPVEEERLSGLVRFLARVLESLERAGARRVRLQVDWDGGTVIIKRGSSGVYYGVYTKEKV